MLVWFEKPVNLKGHGYDFHINDLCTIAKIVNAIPIQSCKKVISDCGRENGSIFSNVSMLGNFITQETTTIREKMNKNISTI